MTATTAIYAIHKRQETDHHSSPIGSHVRVGVDWASLSCGSSGLEVGTTLRRAELSSVLRVSFDEAVDRKYDLLSDRRGPWLTGYRRGPHPSV
ncbi:hypothetical protein BHM03_00010851 [Ensete ventricosum]|nr:hypothetical protein BHM03_00010851 [Ensete ventricosum]